MGYLIFLLALPFSLFAAPAPISPPISVSRQMVCGVASWSGDSSRLDVRCWDLAAQGKPLPSLPLLPQDKPTALAVSERRVCVTEANRVRCWDYASGQPVEKHWFDEIKAPMVIAGGSDGDFCSYDRPGETFHSRRFYCTGLGTSGNLFVDPYSMAIGSAHQVCLLQPRGRHRIDCIISLDSPARGCEETIKQIYFDDNDLRRIYVARGAQPDCQACTVGVRNVHCWGDGHIPKEGEVYRNQTFRQPTHLAFLTVPEVKRSGQTPCVLDGGKVSCLDRPEHFRETKLLADFANAVALDGVDETFCALNNQEWYCQAGAKPFRIYHGLELRFEPAHFEAALAHLAERVYRDKADLLNAVVKALGKTEDAELRHFALLAATEILDDIHTDQFEQTVQPKLHATLETLVQNDSKAKLGDFKPAPNLVIFSLTLAHTALEQLSHDSPAARELYQDLTVALGNALAARGDAPSLRELTKQYALKKQELSAPGNTARRLLNALFGFLSPG